MQVCSESHIRMFCALQRVTLGPFRPETHVHDWLMHVASFPCAPTGGHGTERTSHPCPFVCVFRLSLALELDGHH